MIITLLGTGGSTKYKRPGKSYRTRSSILIKEGGSSILVDISLDFLEQSKRKEIEKIDYILFTHGHHDIIGGIHQLKEWMDERKIEKIPAYAEEGTWKVIKREFKNIDHLEQRLFIQGKTFGVDDLEITPFRVKHSVRPGFPTVGFNFNHEFTYVEDFENIPRDYIHHLSNQKLVIRDGAGWNRQFFGHRAILVDLEDCIKLDNTLTIFTQAGIDVPPHERALHLMKEKVKELEGDPDKFDIAYDGMKIDVSKIKKQIISPDLPWLEEPRTPTTPGLTGIEEEPRKQITSEDVPGLTAPSTPEGPTGPEYPKLKAIVVDDVVAEYFAQRKIKAFVKDKLGEIFGDVYVCGIGGKVYGIVHLNRPTKMARERVLELTEVHGLSEDYIDAKWPDTKFLYFYPFKIVKIFKEPREYEKPPATMDFLQEVNFKSLLKVPLENINPESLSKISDSELINLHHKLHMIFGASFGKKYSKEDLVNIHLFIVEEMERRGMQHNSHDELDKLTDKLRRQNKVLQNYAEIKDVFLIEDFVSIVGSTIEGLKDPNDLDILIKRISKEKMKEILTSSLKSEIHSINANHSHGLSVPLYDLVLKRKETLNYKKTNLVKMMEFGGSKRPMELSIDEFITEYTDTKSSVLLEPCFKGKKLQVHKDGGIIKIFNSTGEEFIDDSLKNEFLKIEYPHQCIIDGILLANKTFILTDILLKDSAQYLYEPLLNRKLFLTKMEICSDSRIKRVKFFRCFNKYEVMRSLNKFKENHWNFVIARFAAFGYNETAYRIKLKEVEKKEVNKIYGLDRGKDLELDSKNKQEKPRVSYDEIPSLNKVIEKKEGPIAPYFIVPQDKKKRNFVVHLHYRGLKERGKIKRGDSVHEDIRLDTGEGFLVGWTLFDVGSSTGNINGDLRKSKFLQGGTQKIQATTKLGQPLSWLKVEGDSAPGEVGATSKAWAKFVIAANGKFLFGSQRPENKKNKVAELHEYFLYPSKGPKAIEGRWVIVKLELAPRKDEKEVIIKTGDEDLVLMAKDYDNLYKSSLSLSEWIDLRKKQLYSINKILEQYENKVVDLTCYVIHNLNCDRKAFEEEIQEYSKAVEEGKEPEKPTKVTYLMFKPKEQTPYSQQEKNREWSSAHPEAFQI